MRNVTRSEIGELSVLRLEYFDIYDNSDDRIYLKSIFGSDQKAKKMKKLVDQIPRLTDKNRNK